MSINTPVATNDPLDALVLAALAGDRLAWEQLVKQLEQALLAYLCARGDRDDAKDALQSTWSKAWEKAGRFDPKDSPSRNFRGFLFRIASNELVSIQRRNRGLSLGDDFDTEDKVPSAEVIMVLREKLGIMKECIDELPPEQRELMLKRMIMQAIEVAEDLGVPVGTIHSGFSRARAKVRICMERKYKGGSL